MGMLLRRPPRALAAVEGPQGGKEVREMLGIVTDGIDVKDGVVSEEVNGIHSVDSVGVDNEGIDSAEREEGSTLKLVIERGMERLRGGMDSEKLVSSVESEKLMVGVDGNGKLGVDSVVDSGVLMLEKSLEDVVVPVDAWSVVNVEEDRSLEMRTLVVEEVIKEYAVVGGKVLDVDTLGLVEVGGLVVIGAIEPEVEEGNGSEVLESTLLSLAELEDDEEGIWTRVVEVRLLLSSIV